jgi:FkbM family methyltransferase
LNRPPYNHVLPLGGVNRIVAGRHGLFLANLFDQFVGLALVRYGEYGELEWQVLAQLVKPGNTVVEIGANTGSHTVSLAKAVGPTGRVIAIEPQRIIHQYLCATVALNSLANVETLWTACGSETGELVVPPLDYFAERTQNFGGLSLASEGAGERVAVRRLDDIMGDRPAHLLKIDVEGMEAEVLRGAASLIATHRPVLYLENDRTEKSDALLSLLWSMDYRTYWHIPSLYNPDNYFGEKENIYSNLGSFNLLCLPRELGLPINGFEEVTELGKHPLAPAKPLGVNLPT